MLSSPGHSCMAALLPRAVTLRPHIPFFLAGNSATTAPIFKQDLLAQCFGHVGNISVGHVNTKETNRSLIQTVCENQALSGCESVWKRRKRDLDGTQISIRGSVKQEQQEVKGEAVRPNHTKI